MKKSICKTTTLILFLVLISSHNSYAQAKEEDDSTEETKEKKTKIGLGASMFNLSDLIYEDVYLPANLIYITMDFGKGIRIEPVIGIAFQDEQKWYSFELGFLGRKSKEKFNLLYGIRAGMGIRQYQSHSSTSTEFDETINMALVVGGEYLFIEQFSISSEIQLRAIANDGGGTIFTNSVLVVRFYF